MILPICVGLSGTDGEALPSPVRLSFRMGAPRPSVRGLSLDGCDSSLSLGMGVGGLNSHSKDLIRSV